MKTKRSQTGQAMAEWLIAAVLITLALLSVQGGVTEDLIRTIEQSYGRYSHGMARP
jgi:Tfp pilus assembly protein PilV